MFEEDFIYKPYEDLVRLAAKVIAQENKWHMTRFDEPDETCEDIIHIIDQMGDIQSDMDIYNVTHVDYMKMLVDVMKAYKEEVKESKVRGWD